MMQSSPYRFVNDILHLLFDGLLLHLESVLVPDEVGRFGIAAILLHAGLEKANDVIFTFYSTHYVMDGLRNCT